MQRYGEYIDRVRQILRGETRELMDYLEGEMQKLAADLRFEEAQQLKNKYDLIAGYRAKSVIISQTIDDIDVFGAVDNDRDVYVNYMHVRRGAVVRSVTLRYKRRLDESLEAMLAYAVGEVQTTFDVKLRDVVVSVIPEVEIPGVNFIIPQRGDKAKLLEVSLKNAQQALSDDLKQLERSNPEQRLERTLERMKADFRLPELPRHIECFDNSNIQGTNPVASCVVFRNAKPSKRDYRHFKIKTVVGADDFASMKEVLTRRYSRMMQEGEPLPQLIVVDGGKGQLSAAVEALDEMGLRGVISIVGIAKRLEEIYFPGDSVPLYIEKTSESLRVVQHLRDEAHRFGITFHRDLRSKSQISSRLDKIKGIGPQTVSILLKHFKSVKRVTEATESEVAAVVGPAKARILVDALKTENNEPQNKPQ
jgi:excinuclease ABC subunit C